MRLFKIELENYRQFRGTQIIELSTDAGKNVNIFIGVNGTGKTNLLNAVNWCLFADEPGLRNYQENVELLANVEELNEKNSVKVRVKLFFGNVFPEYIFQRHAIIEGTPQSSRTISSGWLVSQITNGVWETHDGTNWTHMTEFDLRVDEIIPKSIRNFFFFDGENLDKFFMPGYQKRVRDAITRVCQIELLERTINHLQIKESELRKKTKGESSKVDNISNEIDTITRDIETIKSDIRKIDDEYDKAEKNKIDLEEKLQDYGHPDVEILKKERDQINKTLARNQTELKEKEREKLDYFASNIIYAISLPILKKALSTIEIEKNTSKTIPIPPNVRDKFLKDLLKRQECICGTPLNEGSIGRNNVEEFLRKLVGTTKISDEALKGYYAIDPLIQQGLKFLENRSEIENKIIRLNADHEFFENRLKDISKKISGIPIDEIQNIESKIQQFSREMLNSKQKIGEKTNELKHKTNELERRKLEFDEEIRKDRRMNAIREKITLCNQSLDILFEIKNIVTDKVRRQVEQKTKEYFFEFHWKKEKDAFKDVIINDKYEVSVIGAAGRDFVNYLSSGEGQILALSFMAALSSVSGFDSPVIIDTPLGRISGKPKENIAKFLPNYLKHSQLTLLCTDEEYSETVQRVMKQRIGKEFTLNWDGYEGKTTIEAI